MKQGILYSYIRYSPHIETGEFVNVGILMCEPEKQKLSYRLIEKTNQRVKNFFYQSNDFEKVQPILLNELEAAKNKHYSLDYDGMVRFFHNYVDRREGVLQYSPAIVTLTDNPEQVLNETYERYINK